MGVTLLSRVVPLAAATGGASRTTRPIAVTPTLGRHTNRFRKRLSGGHREQRRGVATRPLKRKTSRRSGCAGVVERPKVCLPSSIMCEGVLSSPALALSNTGGRCGFQLLDPIVARILSAVVQTFTKVTFTVHGFPSRCGRLEEIKGMSQAEKGEHYHQASPFTPNITAVYSTRLDDVCWF